MADQNPVFMEDTLDQTINDETSEADGYATDTCSKDELASFSEADGNIAIPEKFRKIQSSLKGEVSIKLYELLEHPETLPFSDFIILTIANPQAYGQKPISYYREVLSLLINPDLLKNFNDTDVDIYKTATRFLKAFPSFGNYSNPKGIEIIREDAASWYETRDGVETDPNNIILTDGVSAAFQFLAQLLISDISDGILIPVPLYPMYPATITRTGGTPLPYFLKESSNWDIDLDELRTTLEKFRTFGGRCNAIVIIDPGNPTGMMLTRKRKVEVLRFCVEHRLAIIADETYQDDIYVPGVKFFSFRQIAGELDLDVELFTIYSASKGLTGECGFRGGVIVIDNMLKEIVDTLTKLVAVSHCANTMGQAVMGLMFNPPKPGDSSYAQFKLERTAIYDSLRRRAQLVQRRLNRMEGISCRPIRCGMSAYPKIELPDRFLRLAKEQDTEADLLFCVKLLENTGVATVPGTGFSQPTTSYHFRMTLLASEERLTEALNRIERFNTEFRREFDS